MTMQIHSAYTDQAAALTPSSPRIGERGEAAPASSASVSGASTGNTRFGRVWSEALGVNKKETQVTVKQGDTLIGLTRQYLGQNAGQFTAGQVYGMAKNLASANGIANPDLIFTGQTVNLAPLASMSTLAALQSRQPVVESIQLNPDTLTTATPVLDKTLARAVAKGYVSDSEQSLVRGKILALAQRHNFAPDDFATLTLMESDGMNPRASNGNCHGIIQFCDGSNRGAASAGLGSNPQAILSQSVLQQLDLVDHYFTDTRLKQHGPASLDDLYLTVLTPAARSEKRPDAPLNIAGRQAASLYEGRDQSGVITRNSLLAGLRQNARQRLASITAPLAQAEQ